MKAKYLIVGLAVTAVLMGGWLVLRSSSSGKAAAKTTIPQKSMQTSAKAAAVKKVFSKNMGGLTIQILNARNKSAALKAKAFRSVNSRSAVYMGPLVSNKMRELAPGSYDIELETVPQTIYKGIRVSAGQETVEDLGCVTGMLNVKVMNAKNTAASCPISVCHPNTNNTIITTTANRPIELLAGAYDIEIGILPKVVETAVTVEPGKEKVLDLGVMTGTLIVKAVDEKGMEKKDARQSVKVKKAGTGDLIINTRVNKPIELRQGTYDIEIGTIPLQINRDAKVKSGEEAVVEVIIHASSQAKTPEAAVPSPKMALPAKAGQD